MHKLIALLLVVLAATGWGLQYLWGDDAPEGLLSGKTNIVVLGTDTRKGDTGRSDTLFVVMMDPDNKGAALLSVPRDTRVKIQGHGWDKINAAYAYGGHELTQRTVRDLLGLRIDHYVVIDFQGFKDLVDVIGGIDINVEKRMYYYDPYDNFKIDLQPGLQHMDGRTAIQYVRFRDGEGDIGRIRRQQKFILAMYQKITSGHMIARIPSLAKQILSMIKTDMGMQDMLRMGKALHDMMEAGGLKMAMVPGTPKYIDGISYWLPDIPKTRELMAKMQDAQMSDEFRANTKALEKVYEEPAAVSEVPKEAAQEKAKAPEEEARKQAAEAEKTRKAAAAEKAAVPGEARATYLVHLVNCTGKDALADKAKLQLERAGFRVIVQGDGNPIRETVVLGTSTGNAVSASLRRIPFRHVTKSRDVKDAGYDGTIFLGKDFR
ncbi:MAG: LCP family protein [Succiniclasticum sp.]|nr:LCP family protein [Succiniclasticum sp.]